MLRYAALLAAIALACPAPASAQTLNVRHYTIAEGLAQDTVEAIFQDSRGYLWFATAEGLSRFDGYRFRNYGVQDGVPQGPIESLGEDPSGRLWLATFKGG